MAAKPVTVAARLARAIGLGGLSVSSALIACGGGPPAPPSPQPATVAATSTFTRRGAGYESTNTYSTAGGGLVFCRRESGRATYLWVRLAASPAGDGGNGPHLDLDVCNFSGSSTHSTPHDTSSGLACASGATWDVWWHDGPRTFVSAPGSSPCEIALTLDGTTLDATFQCRGLAPFQSASTDTLDVISGTFRCTYP